MKELYVLKNEKGEYYTLFSERWTNDIHKATVRIKDCIIRTAKELMKQQDKYDEGKYTCLNPKLYYGFRRLFLVKIKIEELEKVEIVD